MRRSSVSLILLVAVLLGIVGVALAAEFPVSKLPAGKSYLAVSGKKAVWLTAAPSVQSAQLICVDLKAKPNQPPQVIQIPSMYSGVLPGDPPPSISGNTIVWSVGSNLYKYDLVSRQTALVTSSPGRIRWPVVDGNIVVWQDLRRGANNGDIYGYDLSGGPRGVPFRICTTPNNQEKPVVAGDVVAWTEKEMDPKEATKFTYKVYYARISLPGFATLIHTVPPSNCAVILGISGETLVWGEHSNARGCQEDIYSYNIKTQKKLPICTGPWFRHTSWHNGVSGKIVIWSDWRDDPDSQDPNFPDRLAPTTVIYGYDLATGQEFPITSNPTTAKCCPSITGNTAVWLDWRSEPAGIMKGAWNASIYGESFKVPAHTIVVGKGRAKPGESGLLSVSLKGGTGVYALVFDLNYDAAMLDIPLSINAGAALANWNFTWKDLGNGKLHIEAHSPAGPLSVDGEVARVKFGVKNSVSLGAQCTVWASGITLKDQYLQDIKPVGDVIGKFGALPLVDHFAVKVIPGPPEPQGANALLPFGLLVEARDEEDQLATQYAGSAKLFSTAGNCSPHNLNFANGVWNGSLAISHDQPATAILTAFDATMPASGTSSSFALRTKGDVDGTGNVDFLDVLCAANLAIGKYVDTPPRVPFQDWAANVNGGNVVNVLDVIGIINMSLGRTPATLPPQAPITVSLNRNLATRVWEVKVSNATGLAGMQFEIPATATLSKGPLASGWNLNKNIVKGKLRVIAYSPNAAGISANSGVLLRISGITGAPKITNRIFSEANGNAMPAFP